MRQRCRVWWQDTSDEAYAAGILARALDPSTQAEAVRSFLRAEERLVAEPISRGARVVDFGCGMGRHLIGLQGRTSLLDPPWAAADRCQVEGYSTWMGRVVRISPRGPGCKWCRSRTSGAGI